MMRRKFTVVTQLHEENNQDIIEYVDNSLADYGKAKRETFYTIMSAKKFNKSKHNTYLQNKYGITKRTANSIISDVQGTYNALKELKEYELKQIGQKIRHLEDTVLPKLIRQRNHNSLILDVHPNKEEIVIKQQNLRKKIAAKKNKLNKLYQQKANLEYQLDTGRFKICFGTKKLLKQNYAVFVKRRDSQMSFVGSKDETAGNQTLQLSYNKQNNQFTVKLRKDFGGFKQANRYQKYAYGKCYYNHHKDKIIETLTKCNAPLSYKIIKKNDRFYLHCTFEYVCDDMLINTRVENGTIGLDFNKGFITAAETNCYGHMVHTMCYPYHFKSGNVTENDLYETANRIVKQAFDAEKCIVIEDLNFKQTKAKTETKQGKKYNDMLHSLAYKKFVHIIESVTYRNNVRLIKVNPAWTSYIAKHKYCNGMKLNIHTGASYVIARKGQGYTDKIA